MTHRLQHVLVIGAGTVGACCAWHLAAAGHEVTLIDRELPGQTTSSGNAACISPSQVVPFSHPGVWKKLPRWLLDPLGPLTVRWQHLPWVAPWLWRFWRSGTAAGVQRCARAQAALMQQVSDDYAYLLNRAGLNHFLRARGVISVHDTPEAFAADRWVFELEAELGFEWHPLSAGALKELAPALRLDDGVAIFVPSWQNTTNPARMTAAIAEHAMGDGVHWRQGAVSRVQAGTDGVAAVLEGGGKVQADALVVAGGAWSNTLAAQLDFTVPMTAKRGYHTMLPDPGITLDVPIISASRSFVMTPLEDGLRLAGTAEFARLDAAPAYERAEVLVRHAKDYLPGLQTGQASEWMGQRPMMVDSVPIISTSPRHDNVFYAFGHGHYGLTQGPTTGRLIAALVAGEPTGLDMTPYRMDRFS